MPTNLVGSKQDEADWAEARRIVDKQYPDKSPDDKDKSYWKLTTSIYENIKKNRGKKKMQKQASVGGILAEQIHLRKTAAGDDRQYTVFLRDWIAEQYKNGRDPVEEMRRISQQQPAGIQQPSDQPHTVQPTQPSGAPVVPANPAVQRVPARGQLNNAVQKKAGVSAGEPCKQSSSYTGVSAGQECKQAARYAGIYPRCYVTARQCAERYKAYRGYV